MPICIRCIFAYSYFISKFSQSVFMYENENQAITRSYSTSVVGVLIKAYATNLTDVYLNQDWTKASKNLLF